MKKFLALMVIAAMTLFGVSAFAGVDLKIDDDTFSKFGAKARIQYSAANPGADTVDVGLGEGRIYFAGQVTNTVKFGFNYDFALTGAAGGRASDALVMFDLAKEFKINTGIYRMAFSRIGLQDSYQYILINSPDVGATGYVSSGLAGWRVGGVTAWGDLANGMIRYNVGVSDGDYAPAAVVAGNEIGMSARVVLNFMDPEKGYTCPGCYLGKAKVANVGVGYFTQDDNTGTQTYTATTVDAFYDANNATLEAAYFMYDYDTGAIGDSPSGWYVEAAYALDKIQPAVRYESWDADGVANSDFTKIVAGVNYLISGHDAKVGVEYAMKDLDGTGVDTDTLMVQVQVQF